MAYPVVASFSSALYTGTAQPTVPAPSGMAAGDLLIAKAIGKNNDNSLDAIAAPAGWTQLYTATPVVSVNKTYWKIATAGDVSTGSFAFTGFGAAAPSLDAGSVYILRITGGDGTAPIAYSNHNSGTATASPSVSGFTTTREVLLIQMLSGYNATSSRSTSGYAIANNNPSWTETYDVDSTGATGAIHLEQAAAWANQTTLGNTGNGTATFSSSETEYDMVIFGIIPPNILPAPLSMSSAINNATFVLMLVTTALHLISTLGNAVITIGGKWTRLGKSSAPAWTDQTKS